MTKRKQSPELLASILKSALDQRGYDTSDLRVDLVSRRPLGQAHSHRVQEHFFLVQGARTQIIISARRADMRGPLYRPEPIQATGDQPGENAYHFDASGIPMFDEYPPASTRRS